MNVQKQPLLNCLVFRCHKTPSITLSTDSSYITFHPLTFTYNLLPRILTSCMVLRKKRLEKLFLKINHSPYKQLTVGKKKTMYDVALLITQLFQA